MKEEREDDVRMEGENKERIKHPGFDNSSALVHTGQSY